MLRIFFASRFRFLEEVLVFSFRIHVRCMFFHFLLVTSSFNRCQSAFNGMIEIGPIFAPMFCQERQHFEIEDFELQTLLEKALSPLTAILTRQMGTAGREDQAGSAGRSNRERSEHVLFKRLEEQPGQLFLARSGRRTTWNSQSQCAMIWETDKMG